MFFLSLLTIFMKNAKHMTLVHSHFICFVMTLFHEHFYEPYYLSVNSCVFGMIHEKHMIWFHVFEGSLTNFFFKN